MTAFRIDDRPIGPGHPAFVVAEVGINHNGSLARALDMCRVARDCGADAVKFQTFVADQFCGDPGQMFTYRSQGLQVTEPMRDMFRRMELAPADWHAIKAECDRIGITFFSTPQNVTDLALLRQVGMPAIKIGSDDFTNLPLITAYAAEGLPLILSCGMADLAEAHQALEAAGWFRGAPVALLVCTSLYPTPPEAAHLARLTTLQGAFPGLTVGFSDHTQGPQAAGLAVALGARLFEKHFTLDHDLPGPDHWFSETPDGLAAWVGGIRQAEALLGQPYLRPADGEQEMRVLARRSVVTLRDIAAGELLTDANTGLRRPGNGLPPALLAQVLGLRALRAIPAGTCLALGDFGA